VAAGETQDSAADPATPVRLADAIREYVEGLCIPGHPEVKRDLLALLNRRDQVAQVSVIVSEAAAWRQPLPVADVSGDKLMDAIAPPDRSYPCMRACSKACFEDLCELCEQDSCDHHCHHADEGADLTARPVTVAPGCDPETCRWPFGSHGPKCQITRQEQDEVAAAGPVVFGGGWNGEAGRAASMDLDGGALASMGPDRPGACPDGGTCGHGCGPGRCWRVRNASPLGAAGWGDDWPQIITEHDAGGTLPRPRRPDAIDLGDDPDGDNTLPEALHEPPAGDRAANREMSTGPIRLEGDNIVMPWQNKGPAR
jgi:hypothetical protein